MKKILFGLSIVLLYSSMIYAQSQGIGTLRDNTKVTKTEFQDTTTYIQAEIDTIESSTQTPRIPTVYVCAYNSPLELKAEAKYVCDGTADQVEINQALSYLNGINDGILNLEAGNYNITDSINVSSNTIVKGAGRATIITMGNYNVSGVNLKDGAKNITIQDLKISRNSGNDACIGNNLNNGTLENIYIKNCYLEITGGASTICGIRFKLSSSSNIVISDNFIEICNETGIDAGNTEGVNQGYQIINNMFTGTNNSGQGITLKYLSSSLVQGNTFNGFATGCYIYATSDRIKIKDNTARKSANYGFRVLGSSNIVSGNSSYDAGTANMDLADNGNKSDDNSWDADNAKQSQVDVIVSTNAKQQNEIYDMQKSTGAIAVSTGTLETIANVQLTRDCTGQLSISTGIIQGNVNTVAASTGSLQFCIGIDSIPAVNDPCDFPNFLTGSMYLTALCGFIETPATGADIVADCWITNNANIVATITIPIGCSSSTVVNISSAIPSGYSFKARVKQVGSTIAGSNFRISGRYNK